MHLVSAIDTRWFNGSFLRALQIVLLLSFNFLPGISHALDLSGLKPYTGLEYVQRSLAFQAGYGKGEFAKRIPQGNVFLGIQVNDYIGLEAGYLFSQAVTRTSFVTNNSQTFGIILDAGQYTISENKINLTGPQMNFVGRLPFGRSGFSALCSIGVSSLRLKATNKMVGDDQDPIFEPLLIMQAKRNFYLKKIVPKVMLGVEYQMTDCLGIRILMGYEKTSRFKNIAPKESNLLKMTLKDNTLCNIGLIVKF